MKIDRRFTSVGVDPLEQIEWDRRESAIREPDGTVVFEMRDIEVPRAWSQVATDILAQKYFRKAGVPQPDGSLGRETSARQVVRRLAGCWTDWGRRYGYFDSEDDAAAFDAELTHMLVNQMAAPNSPQWFNTGLAYAYGITGPAQGHYYVDPDTQELKRAADSYTHPQPHACFIQSVEDDLVNDGGIMDLWIREARLFKFGSGTGSNFSNLRAEGEKLSGGGTSSGLMSFLRVGDRAAGAIKSGGTTRRAAKMVIVDMDHPDIEKFINWKVDEEKKVAALIAAGYSSSYEGDAYNTVSGQNSNNSVRVSNKFVDAVRNDGEWNLLWRSDKSVARTVRARDLWDQIARAAWGCADPGVQYDDVINDWHTCPAGGRIRASNPCVTGDTLVATADGLARIDSLVGKSAFAIGSDGKPHFVSHIFATGVKEVFQLRTAAGYSLKLTADHRVLTAGRGDVAAKDLVEGEEVVLSGSGFGNESLDEGLAYAIGIAVGDGCVAKDGSGAGPERSVTMPTPSGSRVATANRAAPARLARYAILDRGRAAKQFSDEIHRLDRQSVAAMLRGLFTADGTVATYGEKSQYVSLRSNSKRLLEQTQLLLLSFGIKSKLNANRETYDLRVSRSSRVVFEKEIGFHPASAQWAALRIANEAVSAYADRLTDRVVSRESLGLAPVFDLTEPDTQHFVANGIVVHNCSEYMFLDDTACNLASINLMKFYDADTNTFDVEAYKHAIRLWTIVLEISVLMAQFPAPEIARKSYEYRTLGLGYANLGTLLMVSGIPYDSPRALAISGAISAILTGESYATSAEMARDIAPFPRYKENAEHMLRVMRNHRRAAYNATGAEYENLSVIPMGIDASLSPPYLLAAARECWDRAVKLGEKHGYRNAQATCIAPTGCLVGGSMVVTDRGLMRLNRLGDVNGSKWQDVDFRVLTDDGVQKATKFFVNGVEATRRIVTSSGYVIQGTPTHRVKVVDPVSGDLAWKHLADIAPDDVVALSTGNLIGEPQRVALPPLGEEYWTGDYTTRVPRTMSAQLAELVGFFMGDGSLHSKGLRFCVALKDSEVADRLIELARELFNLKASTAIRTGYIEVALNSVPLANWWEACGFTKLPPSPTHRGKGYHPRIPDALLASNDPDIYRAFIRGLFEADGCVVNGSLTWSTTSERFADEVRTLLLALGFPTTTNHDVSGWGRSTLYVLRLFNLSYAGRFAADIGFIGARKQGLVHAASGPQGWRRDYIFMPPALVEELVPAGSDFRDAATLSMRRNGGALSRRMGERLLEITGEDRLACALGFFYDRVATNEDGGEQLTYDLSVPANVTYIANGFISHNTIGLIMDCDTTGIEPDFALVKFKKLAGGGYFKIINQSIPQALRHLGYTQTQIDDIVRYVKGSGSLYGAPYINAETLRARGLIDEDFTRIQKALPTVFEIGFAFNQWTLGDAAMQRLGFTPEQFAAPGFDVLKALGYSREEIETANNAICGTMTIEGAPHLKEEHYAVFDCANKCGKLGKRFIHYMGHVRMMAAAQPFISGAISKTINMPNEATVDEIKEAYMRSWELGIKAMALYRDGSKLSQPLSNKSSDSTPKEDEKQLALSEDLAKLIEDARHQRADELRPDEILAAAQKILANATSTDFKRQLAQAIERNRLPAKRRGWTQKAKISGHTVFLRTGEYADGRLGEIFVDLHKEGASFRSLFNCFSIAVSIGLQYGVPLEEFVDKFTFTRFEPNGFVDHPNIKYCTSIVDYIFRVLGMEYLGRTDFVQVKPEDRDVDNGHREEDIAQAEFEARVAEQQGDDYTHGAPQPAAKPTPPAAAPGSHATAQTRVAAAGAVDAETAARIAATRSREAQMAAFMGDAPICSCGSITRRNGACYVCDSCGNSMGCS